MNTILNKMANWDDMLVESGDIKEMLLERINSKKNGVGDVQFENSGSLNREAIEEWVDYVVKNGFKILRYANGFSIMRGRSFIKLKDLKRAIKFSKSGVDKAIMERTIDDK